VKRRVHQPAAAHGAREILLLERIATGIEGLRADLGSVLADLAASSNGRAVDEIDAAAATDRARDSAPLLTAADVAALLQVDQRTLRELRHAGDVPAPIAIGKRLRWRRRDVDGWLAKRKGS